jgi:hypothetical protein
MAAVLARPDAAQTAILAALHDAERLMDDLVSRVVPGLTATEENVDRRAVGKLLFLAPNARLLAALGGLDRLPPDPLDGRRIDTLWDITGALTLAFSGTAPDLLAPAVDDQVDRVTAAQQRTWTSSSRSRLGSLTAETASLAGWVAYLRGRQGRAQAYFGMARDAARDAADAARHAFALGSLAATSSVVFGRSSARTPVAVRLLEQALSIVPVEAAPGARAWLAGRLAEERAAVGDRYEFQRNVELSRRWIAKARPAAERPAVFSELGVLTLWGPGGLGPERSAALGQLAIGDHTAVDSFSDLAERSHGGVARSAVLLDLVKAHVARGDVGSACTTAITAYDVSSAGSLSGRIDGLLAVRTTFPSEWDRHPQVVALDERLHAG